MIRYISLGLIMFVVLVASKCDDSKIDMKDAPFVVVSAQSQKWVSGEQDGGEGYELSIQIDSLGDALLDSVYFQGHVMPLYKKQRGDKLYFIASYNSDSKREVPKMYKNVSDRAAVIIYRYNNQKKYYMYPGIDETEPRYQP